MRLAPVGVVALLVASLAAGAPAHGQASNKIDARVLQDSRGGAQAHFLVVLRAQADLRQIARIAPNREALGEMVVDRLRSSAAAQASVQAELRRLGVPFRSFWIVNALAVTGNRALAERLAARADVERIDSDRAFRGIESQVAVRAPAGRTAAEPNIEKINAPQVWAQGFNGQGMVYATADTGVDWTHPALKARYRGWNGSTATNDYNWHDAIHSDISGNGANPCGFNATAPCDDAGHGTHVTGTAVGDGGPGNQIGVAPGAQWIGCRNMDEGVGQPSTYIECLQFFAAPTNLAGGAPNPNLRPDAVGNSYACPPEEGCGALSLQTAVDNVRATGIFMAVAAGNGGPACSTVVDPPGIYDSAVTVGATTNVDSIASFSSRGPVNVDGSGRRKPDLVAPGVSVRSSVPGGSYGTLSGTSMATPHVSGAVVLLWSAVPSLRRNVDATETLLEQNAVKLTTANGCGGDSSTQVPNNTFGYGRLDVLAAYLAAQPPTTVATLGARDTTVLEGTVHPVAAVLKVRLTAAATVPVEVRFHTSDGTAKAGSDYGRAAGTLTYPPGTVERAISIRIVRDRKHESTERFYVVFEKPVNASLDRSRAAITIRDDDARRRKASP